jgi:hypothetical protein
MRKVVVWGFVVVAVGVLVTGAQAQRLAPVQDAPVKMASQVEVVNFPAVQTVGGSVSVGNLPLDGDGNVRVAGASSGTTYRWLHIATALPVTVVDGGVTEPVNVAGWRHAAFLFRTNDPIQVRPIVDYGAEGVFGVSDIGAFFQFGSSQILSTEVHAPQVRVRFQTAYDATVDAWLYLSN